MYIVHALFVRGGISASSNQPRHQNTRNRTDLALRPKATGNNATLVARQEMCHRRLCCCCHRLVSIILVRYVASGMYVVNSTKSLKTIPGFKVKDGNLFPGQIPRRVFSSGRWEMLQTSSISSIRMTIHNTRYVSWIRD